MATWETLTGAVVGIGVGEAAGAALEPAMEPLKQDAWKKSQAKVLDLGTLAALVAQGLISQDAAHDEGERQGYSPDKVDRAIQLALKAAPVAELLELWRRGKIGPDLVDHGLAKAQIEPQYWAAIKELFFGRLDPEVVSLAIQRRVVNDPGYLIDPPPISHSNVPPMPVSPLDAVAEAKAHGIDEERLAVETRLRGIPPAPGELMQLVNRGIINQDAFNLGVVEGDTRQEWAPFLFQLKRRVLTPHEYEELALRGWITRAQADTGAALSGMEKADAELLFNMLGRPLNIHQVVTGLARGGKFGGNYQGVPEPYLDALRQSNIRPEWGNLAYHNRYTYSVPFWWRSMAQANAFGSLDPESILLFLGNEPTFAKLVTQHFVGATPATADPNVKKAQTQLWTATHKSFVAEEIDDSTATSALTAAGVEPAATPAILALWGQERALIRKQLSPKEIVKALNEGVTNPATGVPWTDQDAINALLARGYDLPDAQVLIAE